MNAWYVLTHSMTRWCATTRDTRTGFYCIFLSLRICMYWYFHHVGHI